jgi:hypothetical protein
LPGTRSKKGRELQEGSQHCRRGAARGRAQERRKVVSSKNPACFFASCHGDVSFYVTGKATAGRTILPSIGKKKVLFHMFFRETTLFLYANRLKKNFFYRFFRAC